MLRSEAKYLSQLLCSYEVQELSPLINIGSSTAHFRNEVQSHIGRQVFKPLVARGVDTIHTDMKNADGVDLVANIFDEEDLERLIRIQPKFTICSNLLEHVTDPKTFAERLSRIVPRGGRLFVTVPFSFPYHPDPIDNGFRPNPSEIVGLFPGFKAIASSVCEGETLGEKIWREPTEAGIRIARTLLPFYRPQGWVSCVDHWRWLFRRYKVSCVLLEH